MPTTTLEKTELAEIDQKLAELRDAAPRLVRMSAGERAQLANQCLRGVAAVADDWIAAACEAKGIDPHSPTAGEEILSGPVATVRYLRLLIDVMRDIDRLGHPRLPARPRLGHNGQVVVPGFPSRSRLYDRLLFFGFGCAMWMRDGITLDNLAEHTARQFRDLDAEPSVSLVLGAGNVSSIAATDMLTKLFQESSAVVLKMNPVNDYLGPIFARAFVPLVEAGFLRLIYGGADVGAYATHHESVDAVHITGSGATHDAIVWGADADERARRQADCDPILRKEITSELGNVTPWIIVPGRYSNRQLRFQAENVAASIVNNVSFNCVATKMIVTCRSWPQREQFLDHVDSVLASVPRRKAYYPGAIERFERFAERPAGGDDNRLPWTLRRDVNPSDQPPLFAEESFVCVAGETALDAASTGAFLEQAAEFANERLWGTLGASVTVPNNYRFSSEGGPKFHEFLASLRYGTVAVNHWSALAFALMGVPWGGYPGGTLVDPRSGIGWVHNVYMLDGVEKTVLEGPLFVWPKPLWFPSNRTADVVARRVLDIYARPAWWKLPRISLAAVRG